MSFCLNCSKEIGNKNVCPYCGFDWMKDLNCNHQQPIQKKPRKGFFQRVTKPIFTDEEALVMGVYRDDFHKAILMDRIREKRKKK